METGAIPVRARRRDALFVRSTRAPQAWGHAIGQPRRRTGCAKPKYLKANSATYTASAGGQTGQK